MCFLACRLIKAAIINPNNMPTTQALHTISSIVMSCFRHTMRYINIPHRTAKNEACVRKSVIKEEKIGGGILIPNIQSIL